MNRMRSWLFVPGDSERKLARIATTSADAVVLDLEDAIAPAGKAVARASVAKFIAAAHSRPGPSLWVRVNPPASGLFEADLAAVVPSAPTGIVLPKADGVADVARLDRSLAELERAAGLPHGAIRVLAIATETALGVANLAGYVDHPTRLLALAWGAEDLAAELGASGNRDGDGRFRPLFAHVRANFRLAAAAAGLPAIDTIYADYRDAKGLAEYARGARADGFAGMLAIHPAQVDTINSAFTPDGDEIAAARRVIAAFADGAGVATLDGRMLDRPHLAQARHVLALADEQEQD